MSARLLINMNDPILVFKGSMDVCYGVLRSFSDQFVDALTLSGEDVIYLDTNEDFITGYVDREYKAVIAFMDTVFNNYMPGTDIPLFDFYHGPKFNYWTDHPSEFYHQMEKTPKDYYILTQDRNYAKFINSFYDKVSQAFYLPPAGGKNLDFKPFCNRKYDVSFVGTYNDWRKQLEDISFNGTEGEAIRDTFLDILITQNTLSTEAALLKTIESVGISVDEAGFLGLLNQIHFLADRVVTGLFRERVVQTILDEKICVDVFGESWYKAPFSSSPYLRIHESRDASVVAEIYSDSRISVNVMSWHKDGVTERVLDAMCAGSIVLTDRTDALSEQFIDENEILYYSLSNLKDIPRLIRSHIEDEHMARKGQKKVLENHLWTNRADELLNIIEKTKIR